VVAERGQLTGQVAQVDALAAAVRLTAVGDQRDTERATYRDHAASHPSSHRCPMMISLLGANITTGYVPYSGAPPATVGCRVIA
jgi:hypothetical protein